MVESVVCNVLFANTERVTVVFSFDVAESIRAGEPPRFMVTSSTRAIEQVSRVGNYRLRFVANQQLPPRGAKPACLPSPFGQPMMGRTAELTSRSCLWGRFCSLGCVE
jgi:hypothetical protein